MFCPKFSQDSYQEFLEQTISGEFFRNFVQTKAILYRNLWNFALFSAIFFSGFLLRWKNWHKYFHMFFAPRYGDPSINISQKVDRSRKARTLCFWKTSFVHSCFGTYYALLLEYFGLKFLPHIRHCVYWVLAEIWVPDLSHKIHNKFFNHHSLGWKENSFMCETVWFFS